MSQEELDDLVAEGAIERVAADPETARVELDQARLHVETAAEMRNQSEYDALILGTDDVTDALAHAGAIINAVDNEI